MPATKPTAVPKEAKIFDVGILVVSDTAAQDSEKDQTTDKLLALLASKSNWRAGPKKIVSDDVDEIQNAIKTWTDIAGQTVDLILTAGGTGFSIRDCTPEAVSPLLQKQAPGLVVGMLSKSLQITPLAMMARPIAGVRNSTVIVTLPGSPKGAVENLGAIVDVLPHACRQVSLASSRSLHQPEQFSNPAKECAERSGDQKSTRPEGGSDAVQPRAPALRSRQSEWPRIPVYVAMKLIYQNIVKMPVETALVDKSLLGFVVESPVTARESVPGCDVSLVDGYAALIDSDDADVASSYRDLRAMVKGVSHADSRIPARLFPGEVFRVTTGAPIPPNTSCVIKVEDTELVHATDDGLEEEEIRITDATVLKPGRFIRTCGSDVSHGDLVMPARTLISGPGQIGTLLSAGVREVQVRRHPTIGIITTGNELVPADSPAGSLLPGQVRDTNGPCLVALCEKYGFKARIHKVCADDEQQLRDGLHQAMNGCDVVITSGGASMGETDVVKQVLKNWRDGKIHFGRVGIKPGMPTIFATGHVSDGVNHKRERAIFCLPGNPASTLTIFYLMVLPALRAMSGYRPDERELPRVPVTVENASRTIKQDDERTEYHRVMIYSCLHDGILKAVSTGGQRSSRHGSYLNANGFIVVPPRTEEILDGPDQDLAFDAILFDELQTRWMSNQIEIKEM